MFEQKEALGFMESRGFEQNAFSECQPSQKGFFLALRRKCHETGLEPTPGL
jgi:hypothetical protein